MLEKNMDYKVAYNNWLSNPKINAEAFQELSLIKDRISFW